jgi:electron transfer flavoprotein alpha subunit
MTILVIAEHDHVSVKSPTLNTISAAQQIGGGIDVLVAGNDCGAAAQAAAMIDGVASVRVADAEHYAEQSAENVAALVVAHAGGYSHILAPATTFGKNLLPRVAALLDVAQISDIVEVVSRDTFARPIYAGNALAAVKSRDAVKVITVRSTGFDPVGAGGVATVDALPAGADLGLSKLKERELTKSARPELGDARIIVSGGRGLGNGENYHRLLDPLADKLGAALGARMPRWMQASCPRLPGGPDGQDRGARALHRHRYLRRDSASGRHEGFEGDRRDQQGYGCTDLPGGGLRPGG